MNPLSLSSMFESLGLAYGPMLPVVILMLFALIMLPSLLQPGTRAEGVASATFNYLGQMLSILLMSAGGLPALYAVFAMQPLSEVTYLGLLLVFIAGGALFLWHDTALRSIEATARAVPGALFIGTWRFTGLLITVFASLSFVLRMIMAAERMEGWWVLHLLMIFYGLTICWFSFERKPMKLALPGNLPFIPKNPTPLPVQPKKTIVAVKPKSKPNGK